MGFQFVAVDGVIDGVGSGFHCFCRFLCGLNTDIIIFILRYRPMHLGCECHSRTAGGKLFCRRWAIHSHAVVRLAETELCLPGTGSIRFLT
nr:hypothetical protein [Dorea formicigenerans]